MTRLRPVSRTALIRRLQGFGFSGPFSGGRHSFMSRGDIDVRIPNPHGGDIGVALLQRILHQAGVGRDEWLHSQ
ncbi:MAG: type II toxin-antitoxin system HicA family toxin [Patescibacteria group bacterium]